MKVNTRRAVFEFLSIVVAVVLAMGLTEARQDYLNKKLAQKSFSNIVEEIRENQEDLRSDSALMAKDRDFMTEWVKAYVNKEKPPRFSVNFRLSILSTAAYEVAKVNQSLTHLTNEQNMDIAAVYGLQNFYSEKAGGVFDQMGQLQALARNPETDEFFKLVQQLRHRLNLVYNTTSAYLKSSEDFLIQHKTELEE